MSNLIESFALINNLIEENNNNGSSYLDISGLSSFSVDRQGEIYNMNNKSIKNVLIQHVKNINLSLLTM